MSRDVGQVTPRQTVLALLAAAAMIAASVAVLDLLIDVREPASPAPADPVDQTCEELTAVVADEPVQVTSSDLIECPRLFDGVRVTYTGEAVRAVLRRGNHAWVQLNDDAYGLAIGPLPEHRTTDGGNSGIPVYLPRDVADQITFVGDHHKLGDRVAVEGIFHRAATFDDDGPAIEAHTGTIAGVGRPIAHTVNPARIVVAATGLLLAAAFAMLGWRRARIR